MTKPTKPQSAERFARIQELATQRKELQADARRIESEEKRLTAEVIDAMDAGDKTTVKRGGWRATFEEVPGRIGWKDEALKRLNDGELEELKEAVPMSRRLTFSAVAALLFLVLIPGCLKTSEPEDIFETPFDPDPIIDLSESPSVGEALPYEDERPYKPRPLPRAEEPPRRFTGAVIYPGEPCTPCEWLKGDLVYICKRRPEWSIGFVGQPGFKGSEDWIIEEPGQVTEFPTIEFWDDGRVVETVRGYTDSVNWATRKPILAKLFRSHPNHK